MLEDGDAREGWQRVDAVSPFRFRNLSRPDTFNGFGANFALHTLAIRMKERFWDSVVNQIMLKKYHSI